MKEGKVSKGGVNKPPTIPRPPEPKGKDGSKVKYVRREGKVK